MARTSAPGWGCGWWRRRGASGTSRASRRARRWLRAALERDPGGFPAVRAKALNGLGWILNFQGDYGPAVAALEEAVDLYRELGDESGAALALSNLGSAVMRGGFEERVPAFVEEGEALMGGTWKAMPALTCACSWLAPRQRRATMTRRPPS